MKALSWTCKTFGVALALALLAGCVAGTPAPYYSVTSAPSQVGPSGGAPLMVGLQDRFYIVRIDDRTPFGLQNLPQSQNLLYEKGYDLVRREREADFGLNISFFATARDNPEARAGNVVGGALLGAATGAIIGGALGSPGQGAAIGAGSGAALGLVAPADAAMVRVDISTQSFRDGTASSSSALVDLANVPPYDVQRVVDMQVSRMLQSLPPVR
ncbi:MAG: hypothetical protein LLG06_16015 [Desulfobacteraceae bacterium]|nr:hypothetical protein [Desulfobacteraceae bacterium]